MNFAQYIILFFICYSYIFSLTSPTPTATFDGETGYQVPYNQDNYEDYFKNSAVFKINFDYSSLDFNEHGQYILLDASVHHRGVLVFIDNTNIYHSFAGIDGITDSVTKFGGYFEHGLDEDSTDVDFYYGIDMTNTKIEVELHDGNSVGYDNTTDRSDVDSSWSSWLTANENNGIITIGASYGWTSIAGSENGTLFNWHGTPLVSNIDSYGDSNGDDDYDIYKDKYASYLDAVIDPDSLSADFYSFTDDNTNDTFNSPDELINHLASSPIPEPSTYGILSGGLVLGTVLALRRRGRNL